MIPIFPFIPMRRSNFFVMPAEKVPLKIREKLKDGEEVDITEDVKAELSKDWGDSEKLKRGQEVDITEDVEAEL